MPKKCPPGVFCIENTTLLFLLIVFSIIGGVLYTINNNYKANYNIYMKNRMDIAKWLDTHTPEILARNKAKRREVYGVLVKHPIFYIALALILVGVFS